MDIGSEYYCIKLNSLTLNSINHKELLNLQGVNDCVEFKPSQLQEGNFVAIVTENLVLLKDDYEMKATLAICKNENQCETKIVNGIFELEINEYESSALLDALLSV